MAFALAASLEHDQRQTLLTFRAQRAILLISMFETCLSIKLFCKKENCAMSWSIVYLKELMQLNYLIKTRDFVLSRLR